MHARLELRDLKVHFPIQRGVLRHTVGYVRAVDGVSLEVPAGRTLALVGESGCGKTTVGKAILGLLRPTAGEVWLDGKRLPLAPSPRSQAQRAVLQPVFQDPWASLNPRMTVGEIMTEGMQALGMGRDAEARAEAARNLLSRTGLGSDIWLRYPHEFSGGQRQRIGIARALSVSPRWVVADEPTSALDVSVQAQILNLLGELQSELGLGFLFITHNLGVVSYFAHEVAVMYLGRIVEQGTVSEVLGSPAHPYTQALLAAVPVPDPGRRRAPKPPQGEMPSAARPPSGCHFHPRCPVAEAKCRVESPLPATLSDTHRATCHLLRASVQVQHGA